MNNPAVIMNEAAFKLLLEALTGREIKTENDGVSTAAVDNFLQGWARSKEDKPNGSRGSRDYEAEYEALKEIMSGNGPMRLHDIYLAMKNKGVWKFDTKQANNRLKNVVEHYGNIYRVGRGLYEMGGGQHE